MSDWEAESSKAAQFRAHKFYMSEAGRIQAETDKYNGALMRNDPLLLKLLWAFTNTPAEGRAEFVACALAAQSSNQE